MTSSTTAKYKVIYKDSSGWNEYRSEKKIRETASVFIEENAIRIKSVLINVYGAKNVKIVSEDFDLESKKDKPKSNFDDFEVDLGIEELVFDIKDSTNVDFSKTTYNISKTNNIYINIFAENGTQILNYYYGQFKKEKEQELIEDIEQVIEEIKNQEGAIFEFGILPNLEKQI